MADRGGVVGRGRTASAPEPRRARQESDSKRLRAISTCCECSDKPADVGEPEPSEGALDGGLEVLGESSTAVDPGECSLDDPATGHDDKAVRVGGAFDDFDRPVALAFERVLERVAGVALVGEHMAQPWIRRTDRSQHVRRAVAVLDVSDMDDVADDMAGSATIKTTLGETRSTTSGRPGEVLAKGAGERLRDRCSEGAAGNGEAPYATPGNKRANRAAHALSPLLPAIGFAQAAMAGPPRR